MTHRKVLQASLFLSILLGNRTDATIEVFFSPHGALGSKLIEKINMAQRSIDGAIYMLTDQKVADAFAVASKRGIAVCLVVDRSSVESPWSKCKFLLENNVKIFVKKEALAAMLCPKTLWVDQSSNTKVRGGNNFAPLMHNKYMVVDKTHLWTGSFNWTQSASTRNNENAIFLYHAQSLAYQYLENFASLIAQSAPLTLTACRTIEQTPSYGSVAFSKNKRQDSWLTRKWKRLGLPVILDFSPKWKSPVLAKSSKCARKTAKSHAKRHKA